MDSAWVGGLLRIALIAAALVVCAVGLALLIWLVLRRRSKPSRPISSAGSVPPPSALGKLVVYDGEAEGRTYFLTSPVVRIGRDRAHADLILEDQFISNPHCSILCKEGAFYLVDEASTNGTRLNGDVLPAHEPRPLAMDAIVEIGQTRLRFAPLKVASEIGARRGTPYPPAGSVDRESRTVRALDPEAAGGRGLASDATEAMGAQITQERASRASPGAYATQKVDEEAAPASYATRTLEEEKVSSAAYATRAIEEEVAPASYATRTLEDEEASRALPGAYATRSITEDAASTSYVTQALDEAEEVATLSGAGDAGDSATGRMGAPTGGENDSVH